ncbi:cyclic nucleotide-binding domain-containing protein [Pseudodesulfovibrio sp.]|uniref:cyclic nucleotide-binding domain-containing protein n=1 Tax=unclassified Pseudodesulfovibrio TaxID=2661612 RepID=UPI003B007938
MRDFAFDPSDEATLERLRRMPVFDAMESELLSALLKLARLRLYDEGEEIIIEGETDQLVYFLIFGQCGVNVDGMRLASITRSGDVFGEMGMVDGKPHSATISAEKQTLCLVFNRSFLERLQGVDKLAAKALFYRIFSQILAGRIRAANARLLTLEDELKALSVQRPTF